MAIPLPGRVITTTKCQAGVMVEPVGEGGEGEEESATAKCRRLQSILISPLKLDILKITEDYSKVRCAFILNKKETHGGREKNFNAITLF